VNGEFEHRLVSRARAVGLAVENSELSQLAKYYELLRHWNLRLNLTSLPLIPVSDEAVDRLFVEPLVAARFLLSDASAKLPAHAAWFDLGSGGGSPAIPMKVAAGSWRLTMVESKSRKVAFLREVVRALALDTAETVDARFEDLVAVEADVLTVRAVRLDAGFAMSAGRLLKPAGALAAFQTSKRAPKMPGFVLVSVEQLLSTRPTCLHLYRRTD